MAIIQNGASLFTGDAGSGASEIRRYVIEGDLVEAIIQLPTDLFYNTGARFSMQLPNKLYSYKASTLELVPKVLTELKNGPKEVKDLFLVMRPALADATDFLSVMDCLYALRAVDINEDGEVYSCL